MLATGDVRDATTPDSTSPKPRGRRHSPGSADHRREARGRADERGPPPRSRVKGGTALVGGSLARCL